MRIAVEPIAACWDEISALAADHFADVGLNYSPSHDRYLEYEAGHGLFAVTVRDGDALVGFAIMYVFESMHDQRLQAQEDFFYLLPEYRKGWTALKLLGAVEEECRRRGCMEVTMTTEKGSVAEALLLARGYDTVSAIHRKCLVRADSPQTERAVA